MTHRPNQDDHRDQDRRQDIVAERTHDSPRNVFRSQRRDKLYPCCKVAEGPDSAIHPLRCQRPGAIPALSRFGPCGRSSSNSRGRRYVEPSSSIGRLRRLRPTHPRLLLRRRRPLLCARSRPLFPLTLVIRSSGHQQSPTVVFAIFPPTAPACRFARADQNLRHTPSDGRVCVLTPPRGPHDYGQ